MGKGILKGSQNEDLKSQFELDSGLQYPTSNLSGEDAVESGYNTTSRINTLQLQQKINRRVSFAPDVTFHSFDFVPQVKEMKLPRRKEGKEKEEPGKKVEKIMGPPVEPSQEGETEMTVTEVFNPSREMEMTEIFKTSREDEPMELTEIQDVTTEDVDEDSEPMELTQVPTKVHTPSGKRRKTMSDEFEGDEDMELSLMRMSPISVDGTERNHDKCCSLKEFLKAVGVSFLIDTNFIKNQNPVEFKLTKLPIHLRSDQILSGLYVDMPVLEMDAFVCRELWSRVNQSNLQFQDLENQISSAAPPLLFREYFQSSDEMRNLMNQQLQLVKMFAKLEARKAWCDWRIQHFKGLQNVLLENLGLLQEEKTKLDRTLQKAQKNREQTLELLRILKREAELVKDLPSQVYKKETNLAHKLQLEKFRQELKAHKVEYNDSRNLKLKKESLFTELETKKKILSELERKLYRLERKSKQHPADYDMAKLSSELEFLGVISGIKFKAIHNSLLHINCFDLIDLSIDLSLLQSAAPPPQEACQLLNDDEPLFEEFLRYTISHLQISTDFLTDLVLQLRNSIPLMKTFLFLKRLFPLTVFTTSLGVTVIQLMDYDLRKNIKCIYEISMSELITAVLDEKSTISVTVSSSPGNTTIPLDIISARFFSKAGGILPWANPQKIRLTT